MSTIKRNRTKLIFFVGLVVGILLGNSGMAIMGSAVQSENTSRISINPYGVLLDGGAELAMGGFDAPVRLPGNGGVPNISFGFSMPNDYLPNSSLTLEVLWETSDTACNVLFGSNFMYRAGEGQAQDGGSPAGGFRPVGASTDNEVDDFVIIVATPENAHETGMVRFEIRATPGEFDSLLAGDAVNLSFGRLDRESDDSCEGDVGIAGLSVVYQTE